MELVPGKRYWWYVDNISDRKRVGLFTGEYDYRNGNAVLITKWGERWSIPIDNLNLKTKKGKKK